MAATLVATLVVAIAPFVLMAAYAFTDLSFSIPGQDGNWVGMSNFRRALLDERFYHSLWTTAKFTLVALPIELALGLLIAMSLPIGSRLGRRLIPVIALPMLLSGIAVGVLWRLLLHGDFGVFTYALHASGGIAERSILGNPEAALITIILVDAWQWVPFCAVVLLAGRTTIPAAPYLAAKLDGAGAWRTFLDVTLPGLRPALIVCGLFRLMDLAREFDKVAVLTGGGPSDRTELITLYLFNIGFLRGELGYASAMTLLVFAAMFVFANVVLLAAGPRAS